MKRFFAFILILFGSVHDWHALNVEYGSTRSIRGYGTLSFDDVNRIAASGVAGKYFVFSWVPVVWHLDWIVFLASEYSGETEKISQKIKKTFKALAEKEVKFKR